MKKTLSGLLVLLMLLTCSLPALGAEYALSNFSRSRTYTDGMFTDISGWYEDYIIKAYEYGIMQGVSDSIFDPNGTLTFAQAFAIASRIHSIYKYGSTSKLDEYSSPDDYSWYDGIRAYAHAEGLLRPEFENASHSPISRRYMVHAWYNILQSKDLQSQNTVLGLPDMSPRDTYYSEIIKFYEVGILTGLDDEGMFNPEGKITRAECSVIFIRMIETEERVSGKSFTHTKETYSEVTTPLIHGYRYATGGNIDSVPGGKATADISNWRDPDEKYYELAMRDETAIEIQKSIVQTVRLEKGADNIGYVSFSVPKIPEGYGVYFNFSMLTDHIEMGEVGRTIKGTMDLNTVGSGGVLHLLEGSYRFQIGENFSKAVAKDVDISFRVQYMHKSSNILPGTTKGPTYRADGVCVALRGMNTDNITDSGTAVKNGYGGLFDHILDLWN